MKHYCRILVYSVCNCLISGRSIGSISRFVVCCIIVLFRVQVPVSGCSRRHQPFDDPNMSIKSNAHPCWQGLSWTSAMSLRGVLSLFLCIHGYRPVAMQEENSNSTASEWLSWLISSFNHVYLLFLYLVIVFPSANTHVQWIILIRVHCFNIFQR